MLKTPKKIEWLEDNFNYFDEDDLNMMVRTCLLTEQFIERHADVLDWALISKYQTLTEKFIAKHKYEVYWELICAYQILSEPFIEEYTDYVDWKKISSCQTLSDEFVYRHQNEVDFVALIYERRKLQYIIEYRKVYSFSDLIEPAFCFIVTLCLLIFTIYIFSPF